MRPVPAFIQESRVTLHEKTQQNRAVGRKPDKQKGVLIMDFRKTSENERTGDDMIAEENTDKGLFGRFRTSELGKTLLGEDGVFNLEDVERLAESAKEAVRNAAESMMEVKRQICADTQEIRQNANDVKERSDMEGELRQTLEEAETVYRETVRRMESEGQAETEERKERQKDEAACDSETAAGEADL